jgi:hypothetical protein
MGAGAHGGGGGAVVGTVPAGAVVEGGPAVGTAVVAAAVVDGAAIVALGGVVGGALVDGRCGPADLGATWSPSESRAAGVRLGGVE